MLTPIAQIIAAWEARLATFHELHAQVDGEALCQLALADLRRVHAERENEALSLQEAAAESGYHEDSLTRLVREGKLANVGSKHRPRFRRADLPRRASHNTPRSATIAPGGVESAGSARRALARRIQAREG